MSERDPRKTPQVGDVLTRGNKIRVVQAYLNNVVRYTKGDRGIPCAITLAGWRKWALYAHVLKTGGWPTSGEYVGAVHKCVTASYPYGTTKKVTVIAVSEAKIRIVFVEPDGDSHSAFVLIAEDTPCAPGDRAVITFTQGGPVGGHWKLSAVGKIAPREGVK